MDNLHQHYENRRMISMAIAALARLEVAQRESHKMTLTSLELTALAFQSSERTQYGHESKERQSARFCWKFLLEGVAVEAHEKGFIVLNLEDVEKWWNTLNAWDLAPDCCLLTSYFQRHLNPKKRENENLLHGIMYLDVQYRNKVSYTNGHPSCGQYLPPHESEKIARNYFFHVWNVIESLEKAKRERKDMHLVYLDAAALKFAINEVFEHSPEAVKEDAWNLTIRNAWVRLQEATSIERGIKLSRPEIQQILTLCYTLHRPTPSLLPSPREEPMRPTTTQPKITLTKARHTKISSPKSVPAIPASSFALKSPPAKPSVVTPSSSKIPKNKKIPDKAATSLDEEITSCKTGSLDDMANIRAQELADIQHEHEEEVKELRKQIATQKATADAKYADLHKDFIQEKQKVASAIQELKDTQQQHDKVMKGHETELQKFKESGNAHIMACKKKAEGFKAKYDEEVSSNSIRKLDHDAMAEMFDAMKNERDEAAQVSKADKLRITELEKEVGALRSQRSFPDLDQRAREELDRLRQENDILHHEKVILGEEKIALVQQKTMLLQDKNTLNTEVTNLRKEVAGLKQKLAATEARYSKTAADLTKERAKPKAKEGSNEAEALLGKIADLETSLETEGAAKDLLQNQYYELLAALEALELSRTGVEEKWQEVKKVMNF